MPYTTLIQAAELQTLLAEAPSRVLVFDCGFDLADAEAGRAAYAAGHVPGARYLHLETDLSAPKTGRNGRHPLPARESFVRRLEEEGAGDDVQIVAYDRSAGMFAARLWWMLRWIGHAGSAVLDGGFASWQAAGGAVTAEAPSPRPRGRLSERPSLAPTLDHHRMRDNLQTGARLVLDARAADRFRGENETLDPIGGHIPGAKNRFFRDNLGADGRFKPADRLRAEFDSALGGRPANEAVAQCGSGVTACHHLLALEIAGLRGAALYPGSWSEWSAQPGAPIATGSE